ncbi:MAG: helix-turn-helix domain-containing protein [Ewingella sp.]|uniref:helix-turn-helix domain-containing protein n=1 Tax=Ewingella TaxID=41201 RepID=UPI0033654544
MSTSLGKKIRDVREAEGLSRQEFAELTGVAEGAQKFYETDRRAVGSEMLLKITQHPRFEKYTLWLMTDKTMESAGQISPALSPDGQNNTSSRQNDQKVG